MPVFNNMLAGASGGAGGGGYQIERSLRFNDDDSAYLSQTPSSAGNRKTWTWSCWVKRGDLSATSQHIFGNYYNSANDGFNVRFSSDTLHIFDLTSGSFGVNLVTDRVFRDPSAWYHLVIAFDTTQSTSTDRLKLYVNGVQETSFSSATYPNQDTDYNINTTNLIAIGRGGSYAGQYFDGSLADIHFVDGQGLAASDFGEYDDNNVWQPKEYSGSYGTNGFHLDFSDNSSNSALGTDNSSNSNNFTVTSLSVASGSGNDSLRDSPTNGTQSDTGAGGEVSGNYCTWNPLVTTTNNTLANGNLEASHAANTSWTGGLYPNYGMHVGNMGVTSGKYYWEGEFTSGNIGVVGVVNKPNGHTDYVGYGDTSAKSVGFGSTHVYNNGFGSYVSSMPSISVGDIIGVAIDMDNGKLYFSVNGTYINSGNPAAGTGNVASGLDGETIFPAVSHINSADGYSFTANFGQRAFAYSAPSGYKALCTANLPDPTIADPSKYFDTKLWTGNGSTQNITGYSFSPDLVWTKQRNSTGFHALFDPIRGVHNAVRSNSANGTYTDNGLLTAFNSDGFSIGSAGDINGNNNTYVGWAWDAASSNTSIATGGLNSSLYNQTQTWSTNASVSSGSFGSGEEAAKGFDGNLSSKAKTTANGASITITFSNVTVASVLRVRTNYTNGSGSDVEVNDTSYGAVSSGSDGVWKTITGFTGSLTKIEFEAGGSVNAAFSAIEVDGKILVDNGTTPPNVPSIATTIRANPSAGFSIVTYTGNGTQDATVGHGLNATPDFVLTKGRTIGNYWAVHHSGLPSGHYLRLNLTMASEAASHYWNAMSSSVMTMNDEGTSLNNINNNGEDYVSYCWNAVEGYSAVGVYKATNSTSGSFVYTGMRPKFVLIKCVTGSEDWVLYDSTRQPTNFNGLYLRPNLDGDEGSGSEALSIDMLSNGFKPRGQWGSINDTNTTDEYIWIAFAEHPFKTARAR